MRMLIVRAEDEKGWETTDRIGISVGRMLILRFLINTSLFSEVLSGGAFGSNYFNSFLARRDKPLKRFHSIQAAVTSLK
jgi:hypothetical protein